MKVVVRDAAAADVPLLCRIASAAYRTGFAGILPQAALDRCDPAFFADRLAREQARIRVDETDGAVRGFALVTGAHLAMLFVDPSAAGRGTGARLLADAVARGARTLETFAENHAARAFYERHGWRADHASARDFMGATHGFLAYVRD